jgi:hypothetical protein
VIALQITAVLYGALGVAVATLTAWALAHAATRATHDIALTLLAIPLWPLALAALRVIQVMQRPAPNPHADFHDDPIEHLEVADDDL